VDRRAADAAAHAAAVEAFATALAALDPDAALHIGPAAARLRRAQEQLARVAAMIARRAD
jgi:hypothetical protein